MKILKKIILLLLVLATLPTLGTAEVDNTTAALAQGLCPIMDGNPVDDSLYVDYQGERIFFCCPPCVDVFNDNPGKYLNALPQFTETSMAEQTTCPVMLGNPIDPSLFIDHEGQRIYFCCKMCVSMFSENPQEYMPNLPKASSTDHGDEAAHDHGTDHGTLETNKVTTFIGKFHPVAVHLPIALFLVAALAELLFLITGVPLFRSAARFNLLIAVPTAAISVLLGFAAATGTDYPQDYTKIFLLHRSMGVISLILGIVATLFSELTLKITGGAVVKTYRVALLLTAISVSLTGHLGGLLVYGLNHFSW